MKIIHVVYSLPLTLPAEERGRIQKEIDDLTGLEYRKVHVAGDVSLDPWDEFMQTDEGSQELLEKFKAISNELRVLLLPRDSSENWAFYPDEYRAAVSILINRNDSAGTTLRKVRDYLNQSNS